MILAGATEHQFPGWYIDQLKAIKDNGYRGKVELDLDVLKELNNQDAPTTEAPPNTNSTDT